MSRPTYTGPCTNGALIDALPPPFNSISASFEISGTNGKSGVDLVTVTSDSGASPTFTRTSVNDPDCVAGSPDAANKFTIAQTSCCPSVCPIIGGCGGAGFAFAVSATQNCTEVSMRGTPSEVDTPVSAPNPGRAAFGVSFSVGANGQCMATVGGSASFNDISACILIGGTGASSDPMPLSDLIGSHEFTVNTTAYGVLLIWTFTVAIS